MKNAEATAKAFMAIAAAEFFLFLGFMYAEGNENFRLMCISGLILGGGTAAALAASTLCSFAKESFRNAGRLSGRSENTGFAFSGTTRAHAALTREFSC